MKRTQISVQYACKFNDPQKRYMNHNYGCSLSADLEPGDDAEACRIALAAEAEAFVNNRRTLIYKAAELEEEFKTRQREFKYAVDEVRHYEEGSVKAREKKIKANKLYEELQQTQHALGKLGVQVDLPKPFIDVSAAPVLPAKREVVDADEEGNDPDEHADEGAGIDD